MRIDFNKRANEFQKYTYFDMNGNEIHKGDIVLMDGREWEVMSTIKEELGVDATNPKWIEWGRAFKGEYGVYPFCEEDKPIIVKSKNSVDNK